VSGNANFILRKPVVVLDENSTGLSHPRPGRTLPRCSTIHRSGAVTVSFRALVIQSFLQCVALTLKSGVVLLMF
jgi:hypothetical protein